MKYIKNFERLLRYGDFNNNLPIDIPFIVAMDDIEDMKLVLEEFGKYFKLDQYDQTRLYMSAILYVKIYKAASQTKLTLKLDAPENIGNNIIYSKEFLKLGLEKMKDYFEFKNNMKKFNV